MVTITIRYGCDDGAWALIEVDLRVHNSRHGEHGFKSKLINQPAHHR